MPTLTCVTKQELGVRSFCFTDCGPSEGCNPDDWPNDSYAQQDTTVPTKSTK